MSVQQRFLHPGAAELQPEQELPLVVVVAAVTFPNNWFLNPPFR